VESKDYERHSETLTIPPAHVALRCHNRFQFGSSRGLARASNLVNLVSLMKILIIFLIIKARAYPPGSSRTGS
jgi:hypothetical protein